MRKLNLALNGVDVNVDTGKGGVDDEEFEYTPIYKSTTKSNGETDDSCENDLIVTNKIEAADKDENNDELAVVASKKQITVEESEDTAVKGKVADSSEVVAVAPPFVNDGSFLELMKKKLAQN